MKLDKMKIQNKLEVPQGFTGLAYYSVHYHHHAIVISASSFNT